MHKGNAQHMKFETLIFDLDGTVSDPSEGIINCVNHGLSTGGFQAATPTAIRRLIGPPLTEIFEALTGETDEDKAIDFVSAYRERYAVSGYRENVIYPEVPAVIARLAMTGAKLGICTSKRADYAEKIVDMFDLRHYFAFVDGGDIHVKKFTQLEKLVANGMDAAGAVMIGDRAVDIEAARINDIASIGVSWGFGDKNEIAEANPDFIADRPEALLEILG